MKEKISREDEIEKNIKSNTNELNFMTTVIIIIEKIHIIYKFKSSKF